MFPTSGSLGCPQIWITFAGERFSSTSVCLIDSTSNHLGMHKMYIDFIAVKEYINSSMSLP